MNFSLFPAPPRADWPAVRGLGWRSLANLTAPLFVISRLFFFLRRSEREKTREKKHSERKNRISSSKTNHAYFSICKYTIQLNIRFVLLLFKNSQKVVKKIPKILTEIFLLEIIILSWEYCISLLNSGIFYSKKPFYI